MLLGDLNAVAPVVTMFFLTVYGMITLVAALETISGDPSWRPRIRLPWAIALAGGIGCFAVMLAIYPVAALVAIVVEVGLWMLLTRRERRASWVDVRHGVYEALIRWSLVRLSRHSLTARNWRPHVIVFADDVARRFDLVRFGCWFSQGRGVVTVCQLIVGDLLAASLDADTEKRRIQSLLDQEGLVAFGEVDIVPEVVGGMVSVAQANGIAGLTSNTILLGLPSESRRLAEFLEIVLHLEQLHKSVIIGRALREPAPRTGADREIHVCWGGLRNNGDMMLLLAHLLTRNPEWRRARVLVMSLASTKLMKEQTESYLATFLPESRMSIEPHVMLLPQDRTVREIIHEKSRKADVVFLGLRVPDKPEQRLEHAQRLLETAPPLKSVFFVKNSSAFIGKLVQTTDELVASSEEVESECAESK